MSFKWLLQVLKVGQENADVSKI